MIHWRFWRRREPEIVGHTVPVSTLFRWYCYDLKVDDPNAVAKKVGLTPVSDEGEQMEITDSLFRVARVLPYMSYINTISDINSIVLSETQADIFTSLIGEDGLDEEELEPLKQQIRSMYKMVSMSALVSAFSSGFQLGLIHDDGAITTEVIDEQ